MFLKLGAQYLNMFEPDVCSQFRVVLHWFWSRQFVIISLAINQSVVCLTCSTSFCSVRLD